MKKLFLCLITSVAALSAGPMQEEFEGDLVIESAPFLEEHTSSPIHFESEEIKLSMENPSFETQIRADSIEVASPSLPRSSEEEISLLLQEEKDVAEEIAQNGAILIDLRQVFAGSPTIYTVLFGLSIASLGIWVYMFLGLRSKTLFGTDKSSLLREEISAQRYESALKICEEDSSLFLNMVGSALKSRDEGSKGMLERMHAEGRRMATSYWQKIGLLNEIAVIAPMLGLLGTVLGMFYAFYDLNRSVESISALFDGLGISVGTTVGGLVVAILALLLHAIAKYKLMRQLTVVEKEAEAVIQSIKGDR